MRRADDADDGKQTIDGAHLAPHEIAQLLSPPTWLRQFGTTAWLAVGVTLLVIGTIWLLSLTHTIVGPLITASVIAAVASPVVWRLQRLGLARGLGAAVLLVSIVVLGVAVVVIILGGVSSQFDGLREQLAAAKETIAGWLVDLGVDTATAQQAKDDASAAASDVVPALLQGLGGSLRRFSSLAVFLSLTALSLFFLLKDGPLIRRWAESHMGLPGPAAHGIGERVLQSLRGYFVGVTLVAAFNAVVVGVGALLLGVPLAGTIAVITFLGAYVPYLGAWGAGAFAVLVALGGAGTEAALGMVVIQLLANGMLQQMVQPIAYGAALGIHPLAVLVVTITGGALFGAVGLILAAPLTSAVTRIAADVRAHDAASATPAAAKEPVPVG
jgi:putative heme transporter